MKRLFALLLLLPAFAQASPEYIAKLEREFPRQIIFADEAARRTVMGFNIQCTDPARVLPAYNMLFAVLMQVRDGGARMVFTARSRGDETRIYGRLYIKGKPARAEPAMYYSINRWGELQAYGGVTSTAILTLCWGSRGPLWEAAR